MSSRRRIVFDTDEVVRSLYFAATSGDVEQLKSLIHEGADVNSFIHDGSSGVNRFIIMLSILFYHTELNGFAKNAQFKFTLDLTVQPLFYGKFGCRNFLPAK